MEARVCKSENCNCCYPRCHPGRASLTLIDGDLYLAKTLPAMKFVVCRLLASLASCSVLLLIAEIPSACILLHFPSAYILLKIPPACILLQIPPACR